MKATILFLVLLAAPAMFAQDYDKVVVPKSMLTPEQLAKVEKGDAKTEVHQWVGLGREIGDAVNSSLSAITVQANNFAQTGVGKLTVILVVWKVIGDQFVHVLFGLIEILIFIPLWIWSYRRTCMDRRVKIGKDQWQAVLYQRDRYSDFTPRIAHGLVAFALIAIIALTVFTY